MPRFDLFCPDWTLLSGAGNMQRGFSGWYLCWRGPATVQDDNGHYATRVLGFKVVRTGR